MRRDLLVFDDRHHAGRLLGERLAPLAPEHPVVVGLPRGGVPVAAEVAGALHAPLDVILVRKLGVPGQPELAAGAIGEDGVEVHNDRIVHLTGLRPDDLAPIATRERIELDRRAAAYRAHAPMIPLAGRTVIVVDDGIATGATTRAALAVARAHGARRVVLAVPVAPPDTLAELAHECDEVVALETPAQFSAVGEWYHDFGQTPDDEVIELLDAARRARPGPTIHDPDVALDLGEITLEGTLAVPPDAIGLVAFAHGSGSSRFSPRNLHVAEILRRRGIATFLLDLLTPIEATDRRHVFDVDLLAGRLATATAELRATHAAAGELPLGYFGASTGAAAALIAAADDPSVRAVVSRGGRPDLAADHLHRVTAPTLLIVGGDDTEVLRLNRLAAADLRGIHQLAVVAGATHLFEEPGTLDQAARLAADWFRAHLPT
jgi:putative phosphoribosyl transferase